MRSDQYRAKAAECLHFAERMTTAGPKAVLTHMARSWLSLAEQAEKNDSTERLTDEPPPTRLKTG